MSDGHRFLVLGAAGFIGRHVVHRLVNTEGLASFVRAVDKTLPAMAFLTEDQAKSFANPKVEFKQANLCNPQSVEKAFDSEIPFDYVINLAAETRYGLEDKVYEEKSVAISMRCATEAAKRKVKRFVEVSTAQVYDASGKMCDEAAKIKPWTELARAKLMAEEKLAELAKTAGLQYVVVRPATVYGIGDTSGLMPRVICGSVYRHINQTMKFLWSAKLQISTVHVDDVVSALIHLAKAEGIRNGDVFNLADSSDSDQGSINALLEQLFGIKTGFQGGLISMMASKLSMRSVAEEANDRHVEPWHEMLKAAGISNTPLSPYIDKELLYDNPLRINGAKIESTGFKYQHPKITNDLLAPQLHTAISMKLFPDVFAQPAGAGEEKAKQRGDDD